MRPRRGRRAGLLTRRSSVFLAGGAAAVLTLSLAACGSSDGGGSQTSSGIDRVCPTTYKEPSELADLAKQAKKEGSVVVYAPPGDVRAALVDAFSKAYPGIQVNMWSPGTSGGALMAKLQAENAAGQIGADIVIGGYRQSYGDLDIYRSLPDQIVLKDAKNTDLWTTHGMKYQDPEKSFVVLQYDLGETFVVNTAAEGVDQLKSYKDFYDPKWKGRIIVGDPNLDPQAMYSYDALYKLYGEDFFKNLAKNDPVVVGDVGQLVQQVAQGANPIGIGAGHTVLAEFEKSGAPIEGKNLDNDYSFVSAGYWTGSIPTDAPHPAAAQLYLNWMLTPYGQCAISSKTLHTPIRTDVPLPKGSVPLPKDISGLVDPGAADTQAYNEKVTAAFYKYLDGPGENQ